MNPTLQLNLLQLLAISAAIFTVAIFCKNNKLRSAKKRIAALENEMLSCHREILALSSSKGQEEIRPVNKGNLSGLSAAS